MCRWFGDYAPSEGYLGGLGTHHRHIEQDIRINTWTAPRSNSLSYSSPYGTAMALYLQYHGYSIALPWLWRRNALAMSSYCNVFAMALCWHLVTYVSECHFKDLTFVFLCPNLLIYGVSPGIRLVYCARFFTKFGDLGFDWDQ